MARTIGRHRRPLNPPGETVALCSYCGVHWPRSKLHRDEAGNLVCPDESTGRDMVALNRENSESARRRNRLPSQTNQGGYTKPTLTGLVTLESTVMNGIRPVKF